MTRSIDRVKLIAMVLVAVALIGVATPVCAMPTCDNTSAGTCSEFIPACDKCPTSVVMKHTHDDAVAIATLQIDAPVMLAAASALPVLVEQSPCIAGPVATASPPPLDPLGVRLTV
jgi:hypothetical protein